MNKDDATNQEILEAISQFSSSVDKRFDQVEERFNRIDERFEKNESQMVTKNYLL